ncbi:YdbT family protein [Natrialba swarupiae]|uniref:DUF4395 domain-containing protein n=1 Tax=Natrialba swarupiae TaxID=2448032 RepID=A0A5D5AMQ5_9EURY|nr:DUF4395 domain-containing protein [Natrialba swarupiae]TYT62293.1 DUF4395 domain-containing protein [Natrialba swarupiae]
MGADPDMREAQQTLEETEPSRGLTNQVPPDEEVQWVAKQDLRTAWLSLVLHKLKTVAIMFIFGIVAAVFAIGALDGILWGFLAFLAVGIVAPIGWVGYKYYYLKNTIIEYAATDQQFVKYKETPSTTRSESLPVNRAKDASYRQDRWDKFLDTGDIYIQGIGRAGSMRIKNIPHSEAAHRMIQQQIANSEQVDDMGGMQQRNARQGNVAH